MNQIGTKDAYIARIRKALHKNGLPTSGLSTQTRDGHPLLPGHWVIGLDAQLRYDEFEPGSHVHPTSSDGNLGVFQFNGHIRITVPGESTAIARPYSHVSKLLISKKTENVGPAFEAAIEADTRRFAQWVRAEVEALSRPPEALIEAFISNVSTPESSVLERIAQLKLRSAVPHLVKRLNETTSTDLRLRLIGILSEIGDASAGDGLIQAANPRDREEFSAILVAISTIGGQRAIDFFEIFAQHDSADVRAMVKDAQRRFQRRHGDGRQSEVKGK